MSSISPELLEMVGGSVDRMSRRADEERRLMKLAALNMVATLVEEGDFTKFTELVSESGFQPDEPKFPLTDKKALKQFGVLLSAKESYVFFELVLTLLLAASGIIRTKRLMKAIPMAVTRRNEVRTSSFEKIKNAILSIIQSAKEQGLPELSKDVVVGLTSSIDNACWAGQITEYEASELKNMVPRDAIRTGHFVDKSTGQPYSNVNGMNRFIGSS